MASKSTKSEKSSEESKITKSPAFIQLVALSFCGEYLYGIKSSKLWKTPSMDRTKSTYFILPEAPVNYRSIDDYFSHGMLHPTAIDFEKFWFELSDFYKDRYLLMYYMAVYNSELRAIEEIVREGKMHGGSEIKQLWIEKMSETMEFIRRFVMEKNKNKFRRDGALSLLVNSHSADSFEIFLPQLDLIERSFVERIQTMQYLRKHLLKESLKQRLGQMFGMLSLVFSGFVHSYFVWVSYDAQNLRRYTNAVRRSGIPIFDILDGESRLNERIEFMRKLKLAAPRWSRTDRRMILDAIETDGKSCRGTYVQYC